MKNQEYELMYRVELQHWWYQGMQEITRRLLDKWYCRASQLQILDAGCGTGAAMLRILSSYGSPVGVDISSQALDFCQRRGISRLSCSHISKLPFEAEQFDLVTSFDVLYHRSIVDDGQTAAELGRVLRKGGRLVLRLPAYQWLSSQHDLAVHTARRYTTSQAFRLLEKAGTQVEYLSYANCLLFPLAMIKRLIDKARWSEMSASSDLKVGAGILGFVFRRILEAEAKLIPNTRLPFGLSVIAVGQK